MAEKPLEQYYTPPPKVGKWEGFRVFLWNSETHQFMGRTAGSWAKILLFYVLFYATLTGFFFAMLAIFYQTIDLHMPKWQLDQSLIGSNPGVGFRPMPPEDNVESTLIWYRQSDDNWKYWTDELDKFLEEYRTERAGRVACSFEGGAEAGKSCDVDVGSFRNCSPANHYGYAKAQPCIFLKLNKIFNWIPEYYNASSKLPESMHKDLKSLIYNETTANPKKNVVWVSCEGENPADVENLGDVEYIPHQGFASYYFPFTNTPAYLSPIVAVRLVRPAKGVLINIECKAWAKNIFHDRAERRGSVHFEVMID